MTQEDKKVICFCWQVIWLGDKGEQSLPESSKHWKQIERKRAGWTVFKS